MYTITIEVKFVAANPKEAALRYEDMLNNIKERPYVKYINDGMDGVDDEDSAS